METKGLSIISSLVLGLSLAGCNMFSNEDGTKQDENSLGREELCFEMEGYSKEAALVLLRTTENMQVEESRQLWADRLAKLTEEVESLAVTDFEVETVVSNWIDTYRTVGQRFYDFDFVNATDAERISFSLIYDEVDIAEARLDRICRD